MRSVGSLAYASGTVFLLSTRTSGWQNIFCIEHCHQRLVPIEQIFGFRQR